VAIFINIETVPKHLSAGVGKDKPGRDFFGVIIAISIKPISNRLKNTYLGLWRNPFDHFYI
jgi:hypothetical protein